MAIYSLADLFMWAIADVIRDVANKAIVWGECNSRLHKQSPPTRTKRSKLVWVEVFAGSVLRYLLF